MKINRFATFLVLGLALTVAATGCKKRPATLTPLPAGSGGGGTGTTTTAPADPGGAGAVKPSTATTETVTPTAKPTTEGFGQNVPRSNWNEDRETFKSDTVYFDFDSSAIKESERSKLAAVASHLKASNSPRTAVRVEGHCDERGTEGYNLALGERRANSVRDELIRLGVEQDRVETVTFGETRPADPGHDEKAWKLNRRAEFVLLTEPK